jgi:hypothetical protein
VPSTMPRSWMAPPARIGGCRLREGDDAVSVDHGE